MDADYGRPSVDRTHIFNASLVLLLPSLENESSVIKHVLGDWEVGTIVGAASGSLLTVFTGQIDGLGDEGGRRGQGTTATI